MADEEKQAHAGEQKYDENFFKNITQASMAYAQNMLPKIKKYIRPQSVIDIGCAEGSWLSVWQKNGAEIYGIDGDYVDRKQMLIDEKFFHPANLEDKIVVDRKFDLAMTLEVAEHLTPERADSFVEDLTKLSDVVMFSAAIPGQGGTNHINEKFPSYWAEKFKKHNYVCIDCIRPQIWYSNRIGFIYSQNILIYAKSSELYRYPELQKFYLEHLDNQILDVIHPQMWIHAVSQLQNFYKQIQAQRTGVLQ